MLSWQLSDPIYQLLDVVSAFCCFVFFLCYSSVYHTSAHTRRLESRAGRARKPPGVECKKSCAKDFFFLFFFLQVCAEAPGKIIVGATWQARGR